MFYKEPRNIPNLLEFDWFPPKSIGLILGQFDTIFGSVYRDPSAGSQIIEGMNGQTDKRSALKTIIIISQITLNFRPLFFFSFTFFLRGIQTDLRQVDLKFVFQVLSYKRTVFINCIIFFKIPSLILALYFFHFLNFLLRISMWIQENTIFTFCLHVRVFILRVFDVGGS